MNVARSAKSNARPVARQRAAAVPDPSFSTTLARGLALLSAFDARDDALSNAELAARTGLSRPTVSRLAGTLLRLGYLRRSPKDRYALSVRVLRVAYPLLSHLRIRQTAQPLMREFAEEMRGSVSIGTLDGTDLVYVETSRSYDGASFVPDIGAAIPLVRAAMGRALLAMLDAPRRDSVLAAIRESTPQLWQRYGKAAMSGVAQCAQRGFCASHGDYQTEVHAVATPLATASDGTHFAINCGVPLYRLRPGELEDSIGPRLVALAASIRRMSARLLQAP